MPLVYCGSIFCPCARGPQSTFAAASPDLAIRSVPVSAFCALPGHAHNARAAPTATHRMRGPPPLPALAPARAHPHRARLRAQDHEKTRFQLPLVSVSFHGPARPRTERGFARHRAQHHFRPRVGPARTLRGAPDGVGRARRASQRGGPRPVVTAGGPGGGCSLCRGAAAVGRETQGTRL